MNEHDLALPYLSRISGARFNRALAQLLRNDPDLRSFGETEKLALFAFWSERGDPEEISRAVEQHPDWLRYAWLGVAKYKASKNDFRAGYELTQRYGEPVALPRVATNFSLEDSEKRFQAAHDNLPLVTNFIVRRCRTVGLMMRFLPPVILANGRTHRPIFIFWKRNVGLRNKIGSALGMPGRPFTPRRQQKRNRFPREMFTGDRLRGEARLACIRLLEI